MTLTSWHLYKSSFNEMRLQKELCKQTHNYQGSPCFFSFSFFLFRFSGQERHFVLSAFCRIQVNPKPISLSPGLSDSLRISVTSTPRLRATLAALLSHQIPIRTQNLVPAQKPNRKRKDQRDFSRSRQTKAADNLPVLIGPCSRLGKNRRIYCRRG